MPKVSVILPAYNTELYIKDAVESILKQSFTDFELLIFDDGSTDNTGEIIQSFNDDRIIYKRSEANLGYLIHLNEGLQIAKGNYIARMDADDMALPERLETQYTFLESNPDVGICGSWCEYIGNGTGINKRPESFEEVQYHMFFGCPLTHPTIMIRKEYINKFNLKYNPDFYYAEDHDFFATASAHFKIVNIPQVLLYYRIHATQIGSAKWKEQYQVKSRVQAKMFSKALLYCTKDDLKWLEDFFTEKSLPCSSWLMQVQDYRLRIVNDNKKLMTYPPAILEKACHELFDSKVSKNILNYFINNYYGQKKHSLGLFKSFLKDEISFRKHIGPKLIGSLLVKSVIGYNKK